MVVEFWLVHFLEHIARYDGSVGESRVEFHQQGTVYVKLHPALTYSNSKGEDMKELTTAYFL